MTMTGSDIPQPTIGKKQRQAQNDPGEQSPSRHSKWTEQMNFESSSV